MKEVYAEKFAGHEEEAQFLKEVKQIAEDLEKDVVRELITIDKIRPDGRQLDEIRPLASEVGLLPRVHGSGLFTRGQTQALSACTLAPLGEHQIIDGLGVERIKTIHPPLQLPSIFCWFGLVVLAHQDVVKSVMVLGERP